MVKLVAKGMVTLFGFATLLCFSLYAFTDDRPSLAEPNTLLDLNVGHLKNGVWHVDAVEAYTLISTYPSLRILDVRTQGEFRKGHVAHAEHINFFSWRFKRKIKALDTGAPWIIYCKSGHRSKWALTRLKQAGIATIFHMDGGFDAWKSAKLPVNVASIH